MQMMKVKGIEPTKMDRTTNMYKELVAHAQLIKGLQKQTRKLETATDGRAVCRPATYRAGCGARLSGAGHMLSEGFCFQLLHPHCSPPALVFAPVKNLLCSAMLVVWVAGILGMIKTAYGAPMPHDYAIDTEATTAIGAKSTAVENTNVDEAEREQKVAMVDDIRSKLVSS